jgi:hypothetical protein
MSELIYCHFPNQRDKNFFKTDHPRFLKSGGFLKNKKIEDFEKTVSSSY